MDMDFDDSVVRALRRYVLLVSEALGLRGESSYVQADETVSAYVALERRMARFPGRDVALLWDEEHGWSAAIETHSGEDLLVVAYFDGDLLPPPEAVAAWAGRLFDRAADGREVLPSPRPPSGHDSLPTRLAAYAVPLWVDTRPFRSSLSDTGV